eukprot:TRINITY_DN5965_c0_g2_i1.p1 TRINITY_DN5965_c0_g2~~TRINITY_DN5965_c0_g2_i1.p1  ORF type:complete len:725 (+),score=188.91 TRINITY_DN5965_c0_g2_i1:292-2466(+)
MDALAGRVGRVEARLDGLREEMLALQGKVAAAAAVVSVGGADGASQGARPASPGREAATAEWVRLFELELEAVRTESQQSAGRAAEAQARMNALQPESLEDALDDLAALMLGELRRLQVQVGALARGEELPEGAAEAAEIRWQRGPMREQLDDVATRLAALESGRPRGGGAGGSPRGGGGGALGSGGFGVGGATGGMAERLQRLEAEMDDMAAVRRHGASIRALADMEERIETLQKAMVSLPVDEALARAQSSIAALERGARDELGSLSVFDAYRVQAGLDQVMAAMEALTRQRNDDVSLLNSYLDEVYKRLDRELPQRKGIPDVEKLRADLAHVSTRLDAVATVQIREVEERLLREAQASLESVDAIRSQLVRVENGTRRALEQCSETEVRVRGLMDAQERAGPRGGPREEDLAEFRRELTSMRLEIGELSAAGGGALQLETRLTMVKAELEALVELKLRETAYRSDELELQVHAIRQEALRMDSEGQSRLAADVERLTRELTATQREATALDVSLRERVGRAERETRAEVRMLQQLVLEVGERMRLPPATTSPRQRPSFARLGLGNVSPDAATEGLGTPRLDPEMDAGVLSIAPGDGNTIIWRVAGIRARVRSGEGRALVSPVFDVPRFSAATDMRLKLFPLGSRRTRRPGHCALYVSGQEGLHVQFVLRLGGAEHGPLEAVFDRRDKETGRHDFCVAEDELEADGSAVVRLTLTRADVAFG